jgi:hypothetical protein
MINKNIHWKITNANSVYCREGNDRKIQKNIVLIKANVNNIRLNRTLLELSFEPFLWVVILPPLEWLPPCLQLSEWLCVIGFLYRDLFTFGGENCEFEKIIQLYVPILPNTSN